MDESMDQHFFLSGMGIDCFHGLETQDDRMTDGYYEDIKRKIDSETFWGLNTRLEKLKNCVELYEKKDKQNDHFRWDSYTASYHHELMKMAPTFSYLTTDRDKLWAPVYLQYIENHITSYLRKPFLLKVGLMHAYAMLQTLAKQRHLIKGISRYHAVKGWTPLTLKRDAGGGPYYD